MNTTDLYDDLGPDDVLCGRGGKTNRHRGNIRFRKLIVSCGPQYIQAKRADKPRMAAMIVKTVQSAGGRFLRVDEASGTLVVVDDEVAVSKTLQALRDSLPFGSRTQSKIELQKQKRNHTEMVESGLPIMRLDHNIHYNYLQDPSLTHSLPAQPILTANPINSYSSRSMSNMPSDSIHRSVNNQNTPFSLQPYQQQTWSNASNRNVPTPYEWNGTSIPIQQTLQYMSYNYGPAVYSSKQPPLDPILDNKRPSEDVQYPNLYHVPFRYAPITITEANTTRDETHSHIMNHFYPGYNDQHCTEITRKAFSPPQECNPDESGIIQPSYSNYDKTFPTDGTW